MGNVNAREEDEEEANSNNHHNDNDNDAANRSHQASDFTPSEQLMGGHHHHQSPPHSPRATQSPLMFAPQVLLSLPTPPRFKLLELKDLKKKVCVFFFLIRFR